MNKVIAIWEPKYPTDIERARKEGYNVEFAMGQVWFVKKAKIHGELHEET